MRPNAITIEAPAKLNLSLRLPARYPDGFHAICSLMIPISLVDTVTLSTGDTSLRDHNLIVRQSNDLAVLHSAWLRSDPEAEAAQLQLASSENTVMRALRLAIQESDQQNTPLWVEIIKNVPLRSGLGGGSSDAAAALIAVNRLLGLEFSQEKLYKIGAKIGSDVCASLARSLVFVSGRGERVYSVLLSPALESWFEDLGVVIVRPEMGVSTPWAYAKYRETTPTLPVVEEGSVLENTLCQAEVSNLGLEAAGEAGGFLLNWDESNPWSDLSRIARNDFDSCLCLPVIEEAKQALAAAGARVVTLSGSGSACAGIFESSAAAKTAGEKLKSRKSWLVSAASFRPNFGR